MKPKLEEITKLEFEENMMASVQEAQKTYFERMQLYQQYLFDKENYNLKYTKNGELMFYTKYLKNPIGFK